MSEKSAGSSKPAGGISIGGNVNTGGGSIVNGTFTNVSTHIHSSTNQQLRTSFSTIYDVISAKNDLDESERKQVEKAVKAIEKEAFAENPDGSKLEKSMRTIGKMAPDILEVIIATITNPVLGLSTVAKKISEKVTQIVKK